ncbi:hypothetical protein N7530_012746 [Penicillium desertorum]|uniref:Uncharacterized protein n=1 Tax=Penicillium desertorum TaxID=1303715 RepID=A0A9W9WDJ5_9EURO|nr:hypothetical protein N7530_012746 [Penicillium desertorum]
MEEHPRDYADPNSLGSERNKMVNGPCTLDYYEDKVQKRTERNQDLVYVHKKTTGKMMAQSLARIDQPLLNVKRRRLINILVGKEGPV